MPPGIQTIPSCVLLSVILNEFEMFVFEELINNLFGMAVVQHIFFVVVFFGTTFLVDFCCATLTFTVINTFNHRKMIEKLFFILLLFTLTLTKKFSVLAFKSFAITFSLWLRIYCTICAKLTCLLIPLFI
jgi:hypothetical protein